MKLLEKFTLANSIAKIVSAINEVKQETENSHIADGIKEIIDDLIAILEKIKALVPQVDDLVEKIKEIIKKWSKK